MPAEPTAPALDELDKLANSLEKAKKKKKETQAPFEFFLSQVAPFDVLPLVKPYHWFTMSFQIQANGAPFDGLLQTTAERAGLPQISLPETPRAMVYSRQALLPADKRVERSIQMMLPQVPPLPDTPRLIMEVARPGAFRPDAGFESPIQKLETHQMVVLVLSADPNAFNTWDRKQATVPSSIDREQRALDKNRYYRLVLPLNPSRPFLSPHPLTWTTMSHVVWEGFSPELLGRGGFSVQQAMLDWVQWGGQLVVLANAPNAGLIEDSTLGPYLPAKISGQVETLTEKDLDDLSQSFPPPVWGKDLEEYEIPLGLVVGPGNEMQPQAPPIPPRFKAIEPIRPADSRPITAAVLEPIADRGAVVIPFSAENPRVLAIERRVGRGRITVVSINPNDPTLTAWPGLDTLLRTVVFRRAEEKWDRIDTNRYAYTPLGARDLSWVRYTARDLGTTPPPERSDPSAVPGSTSDLRFSKQPVAAWIDTTSEIPNLSRVTLEKSSGITIPSNRFVLRVMLAYLLALSPLNWLLCRFILRRKELAWVIAPIISLGCAYGVERAAAVNLGYAVASDEIDLLEIQGGYSRGHLTRIASIYSTGRHDYSISEGDNPTSLVLPMKSFDSLRREETRFSRFETTPEPRMREFTVQPRSLDMFRAEAIVDLGGSIVLEGTPESGTVVNGTDLELLDAVLIDTSTGREVVLGRIGPWPGSGSASESNEHKKPISGLAELTEETSLGADSESEWADLPRFLARLREYRWESPFDRGEVRLVAWARKTQPGLTVTPALDRLRGVRLVVAHLSYPRVDAFGPRYFSRPVVQDESRPAVLNSRSDLNSQGPFVESSAR